MNRVNRQQPLTRDVFHNELRKWYENTDEETIGDVGSYGGVAWVWITDETNEYHLNADTKRRGVQEYLALLREYENLLEWSIVQNSLGVLNKVAFGPDKKVIKRFYLYRA